MLSEVVDLLHEALNYAVKLGAKYADLRFEYSYSTNILVRRGYVEGLVSRVGKGVGVRVLANGSWGFASTDRLTKESLLECVKNAFKLAKTSARLRRRKVELADVKVYKDHVKAIVKENPINVPIDEKIKLVLDIDKEVLSYSELIKDDRVYYTDISFNKVFISSEGAEVTIDGIRTYLRIYVNAEEAGVMSPSYEAMGGVKGFEIYRTNEPYELARITAERAVKLLKAKVPKGGLYTVVLDNDILALIVHEAFGHCAEADLVISGTMLTNKIGQKVASELVTIIDDPEPMNANGWTPYDDEGVKARKVTIVEKGVLKEYMQSRETAKILGMEPTGNARAQSYRHPPLVRMRNTYMLPGDWKPEEIIEETKEGYYLKGAFGGQADSNGEFMFSIQEAWKIENGELKEPYRGVTVSGNALEVLKTVDAVGNDLKINFPGTCGKFQLVPVDGGGPHIRCRIMIGGR